MINVDDLSRLSGDLVAPPPEVAVPDTVWDAVRSWPLGSVERGQQLHAVCGHCGQSVAVTGKDGQDYALTAADLLGLTLAHLIQRHDWTREGPR